MTSKLIVFSVIIAMVWGAQDDSFVDSIQSGIKSSSSQFSNITGSESASSGFFNFFKQIPSKLSGSKDQGGDKDSESSTNPISGFKPSSMFNKLTGSKDSGDKDSESSTNPISGFKPSSMFNKLTGSKDSGDKDSGSSTSKDGDESSGSGLSNMGGVGDMINKYKPDFKVPGRR